MARLRYNQRTISLQLEAACKRYMTATKNVSLYFHTHWDREWYLPFREYQHRLLKVTDGILQALEADALPCFTLDGQTVLLEDYLAFRPQNRTRLQALVKAKKLSIGPWYVMPDEFLVSGESLIRNLECGLAISHAFGETCFTGYLPDTFGHAADIPMLLQQFGITSAMVWRGVAPRAPVFRWQSPSGDSITGYHLTQGYFQNGFHMAADEAEMRAGFDAWLTQTAMVTPPGMPRLFPVGADHLALATNAKALLAQWAPEAPIVTTARFMQTVEASASALDTLTGELVDHTGAYLLPGVFSARLYLKQWNRRLEWRLTHQLEPLLVWKALAGATVSNLDETAPERDFLWKTLLLNHPHDSICGCSVDAVHRENEVRFAEVDQLSGAMVRDMHDWLQAAFQPSENVLAINLGDQPYTGVVALQQDYPLPQGAPKAWPQAQVLCDETRLDETFLHDPKILPLSENLMTRRHSLVWVENLPPHGWQVLHSAGLNPDTVLVTQNTLENAQLKFQITPEGQIHVTNKATQQQFEKAPAFWRNAEQGDSYNAAPVPDTLPEQARFLSATILHSGPLRGTLRLQHQFDAIGMTLETDISLDAGAGHLDFETRFTNTVPDQKIQVVWTLPQPITEVLAEGHFSPVLRNYDPAYRIENAMPAPAQQELKINGGPIQRWISCQNQTWFTEGLTEYEVEGPQLKLTLLRAFGMLSRDDTGVRGSHAGPPLPTPEGQCLHRPMTCRYRWQPSFDLVRVYTQTNQFYGAVYGFDRPAKATSHVAKLETGEASYYQWNNSNIFQTASLPTSAGQGYTLRLMNASAQTQAVTVSLPHSTGTVNVQNLAGKVLQTLPIQNQQVQIAFKPYQLQTLQIFF